MVEKNILILTSVRLVSLRLKILDFQALIF